MADTFWEFASPPLLSVGSSPSRSVEERPERSELERDQ